MKSFVHFSKKHNLFLLLIFIFILAILGFYMNKLNYLEELSAWDKHNMTTTKCRKINKDLFAYDGACRYPSYCSTKGMDIAPNGRSCVTRVLAPGPSTTSPEGSIVTCKQQYINTRVNTLCPTLEVNCVNLNSSRLKRDLDYINMTYENGICSSK